ncbi:hypothetical protein ACMYSQ_009415 [Aspergillus niger]
MAADLSSSRELYESGLTVHSDSENYSANHDISGSQSSSSSSPLILYKPPTIWSILRGAAINLVLPFVNGLMLGFGELFAHEAAYRLGWSGTKVRVHLCLVPRWRRTCAGRFFQARPSLWFNNANESSILGLPYASAFETCRAWDRGSRHPVATEGD